MQEAIKTLTPVNQEDQKIPISLEDGEFVLPNLANATPEFLTQELGKTKARIKVLEKYEGVYEQALVSRLKNTNGAFNFGTYTYPEGKYQVKLDPAVGQMRLNADKVKAYVHNDDEVYKTLCALTESKGYKLTVSLK